MSSDSETRTRPRVASWRCSYQKTQKTLVTTVQQIHEIPPPNWRDTTIKVTCKSGDHRSTDLCVRSPSCSNPSVSSSSSDCNPFQTNQSADQAGFRPSYSTTDRLFTFQQLRQRATSVTSRCGSQPPTSKKASTQWNTAMYGRPPGSKASSISGSRKHTTTMLDELTTATSAHGLQSHHENPNISNTTSRRGSDNTVAVQGMNIEILPRREHQILR